MTLAFVSVAILLLIGAVLREYVRPLRRLFVPGCVVAGLLGLATVTVIERVLEPSQLIVETTVIDETTELAEAAAKSDAAEWDTGQLILETTEQTCAILAQWPGLLIAVVFAAMMLQPTRRTLDPHSDSAPARVGRQGLMVWIIVLGETFVGLLAAAVLITPFYDVPNSIGMLIETGFAGGHGTAAAMGQVFANERVGLEAGLDLGLLMATCGLIYGLVSGIGWINLAARWGWFEGEIVTPGTLADKSENASAAPIGYQTVEPSVIDPLLYQLVWVTIAFGIGMLMQTGVLGLAAWIDGDTVANVSGADAELSKRLKASRVMDFPLFIYTLLGGWIVRKALAWSGQLHRLDSMTVSRISSTAMEVLVVAAITTLKWSKLASLLGPFAILFVVGAIWTGFCLMVLSRWLLPKEHWFELGLINYGMSTGTTATGFVLLRLVDPDLKTDAASDYALAAPLSAPFIGGGILTIALPLIVLERVPIVWPLLVIGALLVGLVLLALRLSRRDTAHST